MIRDILENVTRRSLQSIQYKFRLFMATFKQWWRVMMFNLRELLSPRKRVKKGFGKFPKLYTQGRTKATLEAKRILTPIRFLFWRNVLDIVGFFTIIGMIWMGIQYYSETLSATERQHTAIYFFINLAVTILCYTPLSKYFIKLIAGKTFSLTFTPQKVISSTGNILTRKRMAFDPSEGVTARTEPHERAKDASIELRVSNDPREMQRRKRTLAVYEQSCQLDILYGYDALRVMAIYGEFDAQRIAASVKEASTFYHDFLTNQAERMEQTRVSV